MDKTSCPVKEEESARSSGTFSSFEEDGGERVTVAPSGRSLDAFQSLLGFMKEPFLFVYVLHECFTLRPEGRYQAPRHLTAAALLTLLKDSSEFLEKDGRHGIYVMSTVEPCALGLDRTGIVTAFGPAGKWPPVLKRLGFFMGPVDKRGRKPHIPALDGDEARLLAALPWQWNALEPQDADLP